MKITGKKSISSIASTLLMITIFIIATFLTMALIFVLAMTTNLIDFDPHLSLEFGSLVFKFSKSVMPNTPLIVSILCYGLLLIYIFNNLRMIFKSFSLDKVFIMKNVSRIRKIGISIISMSLVWSVYNYSAAKLIQEAITLSSNKLALFVNFKLNTTMIFCGVLILIFGEIFRIATIIAEENELTI